MTTRGGIRKTVKNHRERIGPALRNAVYQRDGGICQLCFEPVNWFGFHCDHIKPVAHGGSTILSNLRLSHQVCNVRRGTASR